MIFIYSSTEGAPDIEVECDSFEEAESIMFHDVHALDPEVWYHSDTEED